MATAKRSTKNHSNAKSKGKKTEVSKAEIRAIEKLAGKPNPNAIKAFRYGRLGPYTEEGLRELVIRLLQTVCGLCAMVDSNASTALKSTVECSQLKDELEKLKLEEASFDRLYDEMKKDAFEAKNKVSELESDVQTLESMLRVVYHELDPNKVAHILVEGGRYKQAGQEVPDDLRHFTQASIKVSEVSYESAFR